MEAGILTIGALAPILVVLAFILPLLGIFIKRKIFFHAYAVVVTALIAAATTYNLIVVWREGPQLYAFGGWPPPLGISYEVDALGAVLGALTAWVMLFIAIYSRWYMDKETGIPYYYTLLLGLEAGLIGCIYTGDVFNLFVMLEVLSISAYGLVGFHRGRAEAVEAAVKYGIIGAAATTVYFIALVFIYGSYGTLNMADLAIKARVMAVATPFSGGYYGNIAVAAALAVALSLWVFTYKSALFPNHFWLPDAHPEAPTPVSAALSGLVVNIGAYAVMRFLYTMFGFNSVLTVAKYPFRDIILWALLILGIVSGLVGALMMIVQEDIKRLLAYSTVSHIGLVFMGLSLGFSTVPLAATQEALTASLYHLINHSVGKALLFMAAGIFIGIAGTRKLDGLAGSGRKAPLATAAFFIGFLQLMGLPPLGGFFSKFLLYSAFMEAGMPIVAVLVVIISAIWVLGYGKAMYSVWFRPPAKEFKNVTGITLPTAVVLLLAVACVGLGIAAPYLTSALSTTIVNSLMSKGVLSYIQAFLKTINYLSPP